MGSISKIYNDTEKIEQIVDTIQKLSLAINVQEVMQIVRTIARKLTGADGATFILRDLDQCYYADEDSISPLWKGCRFPMTGCVSGWAMLNKTSIIIEDIYSDNRIPIDFYRPTFVKSLAMIPIRSINPIGAIGNYWAQLHKPNIEEITTLQALADITAVTIENIDIRSKLEEKVKERTEEIVRKNNIIEAKNKDITDSILYAKKIQEAKLHTKEDLEYYLPNSFLLFKPKHIVSGDFFYIKKKNNIKYIAASDCTGHGVPGAFLSIICSEKLDDALVRYSDTSKILSYLNKEVKKTLHQTGTNSSNYDGMDIALCAVDIQRKIVKFAGANRPLWIIRNGSNIVEEIKATKKGIGGFTETNQYFKTHSLQLNKGDSFYIFSDGYTDIFSGTSGKKFTTKKFKELLISIQDKPMEEQKKYLSMFVEDWEVGTEQIDDILVIGVRL